MPNLSHKQLLLLTAAAGRPDGSVLPAPATMRVRDAALDRTLKALLGRGLVTELPASRRVRKSNWASPDSEEQRQRGRLAPTLVPPPGGKLGLVLRVVSQVEGATIEEFAGATNWLRHTSRAALTRLRQRGFDIRSEQIDGRWVYRLHSAA